MTLKIESIRRWNARYLADQAGGPLAFAAKIERSQAQVSHTIGRTPVKVIESKQARHMEARCGMPDGWMDAPHIREWLSISRSVWADALRAELLSAGVTLEVDGVGAPSIETRMSAVFACLSPRDQRLLLGLAESMAVPFPDPRES